MFMTRSLKFNLINKIQFIINISIRYIIQNLQTTWLRIFYNIILRKKIALNLKMQSVNNLCDRIALHKKIIKFKK